MLAEAIIIILLIHLLIILLIIMRPRRKIKEEPNVYIIGSSSRNFDESIWPASYWNWFSPQLYWEPNATRYGGYGGWGSRPEHRWTAGTGYKPSGNWGPRYGDHSSKHH